MLVLQAGTVRAGDRVVVVQDWLADDEVLHASAGLVESAGGEIAGVLLLVDALGAEAVELVAPVHALVHAGE